MQTTLDGVTVITGTTHGIGLVTAYELAKAGRVVVMLCRDLDRAKRVRSEIIAQVPGAQVHVVRCDLASFASVRDGAQQVRREFGEIAVLINNAGIVSARRRMSVDGFELTFATNHLGPFLLTQLLLDRVGAHGRIINVASRAHLQGTLDLTRVTDPRAPYYGVRAYAQSKLANVMHAFALARRLRDTQITVNCLHPGVVSTNLLPGWLRIIKPLLTPVMLNAKRGARTTLHLALSASAAGVSGRYFDEHQTPQPASALANDVAMQELLWSTSEQWTRSAVAPL